jgi:bisphosphoglycerate-dependent phosphoglycerate mutase
MSAHLQGDGMQLVLLRHGESMWNQENLFTFVATQKPTTSALEKQTRHES